MRRDAQPHRLRLPPPWRLHRRTRRRADRRPDSTRSSVSSRYPHETRFRRRFDLTHRLTRQLAGAQLVLVFLDERLIFHALKSGDRLGGAQNLDKALAVVKIED